MNPPMVELHLEVLDSDYGLWMIISHLWGRAQGCGVSACATHSFSDVADVGRSTSNCSKQTAHIPHYAMRGCGRGGYRSSREPHADHINCGNNIQETFHDLPNSYLENLIPKAALNTVHLDPNMTALQMSQDSETPHGFPSIQETPRDLVSHNSSGPIMSNSHLLDFLLRSLMLSNMSTISPPKGKKFLEPELALHHKFFVLHLQIPSSLENRVFPALGSEHFEEESDQGSENSDNSDDEMSTDEGPENQMTHD